MAVGMLLSGEGVTKDSYAQLTEAMYGNYPMRDDQSPDGLIIHSAGESEQGWYIYDLWESKEKFQRFIEEKLGPAMASLGTGESGQPTPMFFPIEIMVKGPAL